MSAKRIFGYITRRWKKARAKVPHLCAVTVDSGSLSIVEPCIVEHQPHIVDILPWIRVLPLPQLLVNRAEVHWLLYDVQIVGNAQRDGIDRCTERHRLGVLVHELIECRQKCFAELLGFEC